MTTKYISPWMFEVLNFLSDGEWHERHEVIDHACKFVPPGIAHRRREGHNRRRREAYAKAGKPPPKRMPKPVDAELAAGRRQVIRDSIYDSRSVERKDDLIRITAVGESIFKKFTSVYQ